VKNISKKRKSWREKLEDNKDFPKVLKFDPKFPCGKALGKIGAQPGDSVILIWCGKTERVAGERRACYH
jgi:hypothetical protein